MADRAKLIAEARVVSEQARLFLRRHHPPRAWTEVMRTLKVTLDQCVAELTREEPR
jgi:hypothetical protein